MSRFWKKKSLLNPSKLGSIDFVFVDNNLNTKYLEVKPSIDVLPEWYKNMPSVGMVHGRSGEKEDLTIKKCMPVFDALSQGYVLVTTIDYEFLYDANSESSMFKYAGANDTFPITMHQVSQLPGFNFSDEHIEYAYKWYNPYSIKTPDGYSVLFTNPLDRTDLPFTTMSGVVDTDKYFAPVQFPFFMKKGFSGIIPKGTPVVQIVPFKRDEWKANIDDSISDNIINEHKKLSTEYEKNRYDKDGGLLGNIYKRRYRVIKKYL